MPLMNFGVDYLTRRGIAPEFGLRHELDETLPTPEIINERFRFRTGPALVAKSFAEVNSLLWFPIHRLDGNVNYVARVNGVYRNQEGEELRFIYTKSGRRIPWIPPAVADVSKDTAKPLIFTESFFKGLAVLHAGGLPVAFNGPWINEVTAPEEESQTNNRVLVAELGTWRWLTRTVYFAFDLDQASNRNVRHAVIRAWMLMKIAGATVYQLQWDKQYKGIDDYLAATCGTDQAKQKAALDELITNAKPFLEVLFKGSGGDARLVRQELHKVKMDPSDREAFAKEVAGKLGLTKASLLSTEGVKKPGSSRQVRFEDIEPWDQPVDGNELLGEIITLINKHILISDGDATTVALWIFWTYLVDQPYVEVSPYLGITSPDKRCAKSRMLEFIERLAWRGYGLSSITPSSFFRFVEEYHPTLCIDEFHKLLKNRPELLQPLLNAYSRRKPVLVTNAESMQTEAFDIWGGKAVAYLEGLDDQLRDRVIEINLERKPRNIKKAKLRETPVQVTEVLRRKLLRWAQDNAEAVGEAPVPVFETDNDRAEDNWELLFRIGAVIDPDNVETIVRIAVAKEAGSVLSRESEQDAVLRGVHKAYEEVCAYIGKPLGDPATNVFVSLESICAIMNHDKEGIWKAWRFGERFGAYERKLAQIIRGYAHTEPDRSRQEPNLSALTGFQNQAAEARGFWLSQLRPVFDRYL